MSTGAGAALNKPIISIVGRSNAGKTTLIEKMLPIFNEKGYRIGTIKHHRHSYEADVPGKDSWRHQRAGARQTAIASPEKVSFFTKVDSELSIDDLARYFDQSDLVITDGYKHGKRPKIEVFRPSHCPSTVVGPDEDLIAYATDAPDYPFELKAAVLDLNDARAVVEFILGYFGLPGSKNG